MRYYPIFVDLTGKRCLVVGAGRVGRRKIHSLLACSPAEILVLDPGKPRPELKTLAQQPGVRLERRAFRPADAANRALAFVATPSREVNRLIAAHCRAVGVWCNVADALDESDFIVPAQVKSGPLSLAISTGGASPALAKALREDLEKWLGERYCKLVCLLDKLRPEILALGLGSDADAAIFRSLCASPTRELLANALNTADKAEAEALLHEILPSSLFSTLAELLHELD